MMKKLKSIFWDLILQLDILKTGLMINDKFWSIPQRGSINLANVSRCYVFYQRRGYVIPEDVFTVIHDKA